MSQAGDTLLGCGIGCSVDAPRCTLSVFARRGLHSQLLTAGAKKLLKLQTNGMFSAAGGILTGVLIIVCVFMYVFCVESICVNVRV